ncbi:hypothetical protein RND81_04G229300 [Saponaria officinalis]|uniref:Protein kinase domain-containing protein n=1 Tax=Saponaria officinalis TaxID=3572 RepID=A0AAW1LKX1_SAPOF
MLQFLAILILCQSKTVVEAAFPMAKPGCRDKCGNVTVPYPFGMGPSCYYNEWYSVFCNASSNIPVLSKFGLQVLQITLGSTKVRVDVPFIFNCTGRNSTWTSPNLGGSPYTFSTDNVFVPVHCPATAFSNGGNNMVARCSSVCDLNGRHMSSLNTKESVCLTDLPYSLSIYSVNFTRSGSTCSYPFLVDADYLQNFDLSQPEKSVWHIGRNDSRIPVVLDWGYEYLPGPSSDNNPNCASISSNGGNYKCVCPPGQGLGGNAYLPNGCQYVSECKTCKGDCYVDEDDYTQIVCVSSKKNKARLLGVVIGLTVGIGSLILAIAGYWLWHYLKRRKEIKQRAQNFKRNGGLLLRQQMSSSEGVVEKAKIFTVSELEVATDHFNRNRILGQGGQGTVYKGMLTDGKIVAVKKSKKLDETQLAPFINEVVILSQINHRNVVKLLGCCLETEVPLLVYEFIPNGTLSEHIHYPSDDFHISWQMRLKIAVESAGAIAYLHSSCSMPIYHRDIKSSNILLDEKYRAKVSDFGTSRTIMIDQTHLTTQVAGTFGYLDPEYFQSNQFTEKSDVYSFGVVLVELLTSRRPISPDKSKEWRSLATEFLHVIENSQLLEILDARVVKEAKMDDLFVVANLAKECLSLSGKQRPTMKQVATVLERLISGDGVFPTQQTIPEWNQVNPDVSEIETEPFTSSTFSSRHDDSFTDAA